MSVTGRETKKLFVEGNDDLHVIVHLTRKLRTQWPLEAKSWFGGFHIGYPKSDAGALDNFALALKGSACSCAGLCSMPTIRRESALVTAGQRRLRSLRPTFPPSLQTCPQMAGMGDNVRRESRCLGDA